MTGPSVLQNALTTQNFEHRSASLFIILFAICFLFVAQKLLILTTRNLILILVLVQFEVSNEGNSL